MADGSKWKPSAMDTWEWNVVEWTSLGLVSVVEAALLVPVWEYLVLALFLTSVWLYRVLDFHFVENLLHGFRGEVPRLHHSLTSRLTTEVLTKCTILKQRYFATPWLSSPHLQTSFLHFNGNPPPVKYHRQLFITPDKGTLALDWVKQPLCNDSNNIDDDDENPEHIETPIVVIIPGLTSDSKDSYLKHIAYMAGMKGWRTLVCNHRGLGGVSITSDQFYNAGWTEDLRRIINHVHEKYPKAPIFLIGTSIGANIVVKYLGEEGDSTPVGAAAAVCSPWDLLIGDRFISRNGVQKLYNKVLTLGLVQYASVHQTVLDRIAKWSSISKSKTIRDFDHHCTRHVGQYETVDTYYRRCSSADFLTRVAVPLLCFSALDDPVCTKEAIPWDEILANPNVAMVTTKHGGHLAFFEGFTAQTLWWTRALIEFMSIIIPTDLMHTPQKVSVDINNSKSDVDKGPYIHVSSSGLVAAEDLEFSNSEITGEENGNEDDIVYKGESYLDKTLQDDDVTALRELDGDDGCAEQAAVTLTFKDSSELSSLQSALLQLLQQLQDLPSASQQYNRHNRDRVLNQDNAEANSKNSTVRALRDCTLRAIEVPVSSAVTAPLKNCREVATKLALSGRSDQRLNLKGSQFGSGSSRTFSPRVITEKVKTDAGGDQPRKEANASSRRTFWFLTYVALVTSCPWIGSLLFFWWRRKAIGTRFRLTM
ncbi:hypothetical protein KC19_4G008500 [Ceratodon purpureus]|uniref:AB hydrolase-1 domain-containing protein n=1 Tax=Ceratodon purpureus TaxID=3225 RepID=A0A8T0I412_CERPU|nr:hypothetical protein KC19_4G008500 [Ceratodon purpureus]